MNKLLLSFAILLSVVACQSSQKFVNKDVPNTPAVGFNTEGSDAQAMTIADDVMKAIGGRYAWDMTRYLRWTFFNRRAWLWDKWNERVRVDYLDQALRVRLNLKDNTGKVWKDGEIMTQPDSVKKYLSRAKSAWINDSYWLFMPFKLKDSGVTLKYAGKKTNFINAECDVLELTFKSVGDTPDNRYWIYVNPSSHMVTQWDYFAKATDEKPRMSTPWADYRPLGNILLSTSRGEGRSMTPMGVYKEVPDSVFTSIYDINWAKIK